jgi:hypothetical protein
MSIATMGGIAARGGTTEFALDPLGIKLWNGEVSKYLVLPDKPILPS